MYGIKIVLYELIQISFIDSPFTILTMYTLGKPALHRCDANDYRSNSTEFKSVIIPKQYRQICIC